MASELRKNFRKNLNRFLELNGYNQVDLSNALKVSDATASNWCNGVKVPRMDKIEEIANWLGVTTSDLLEDIDTSERYYYSKETQQIAEDISNDKELKLLFSSARDASPEDLRTVHEMLKALKRKENHED